MIMVMMIRRTCTQRRRNYNLDYDNYNDNDDDDDYGEDYGDNNYVMIMVMMRITGAQRRRDLPRGNYNLGYDHYNNDDYGDDNYIMITMTMMITGAQRRRDRPRGTRSKARAQSTQHWWKINPKLHLIMIKMMRMITVIEIMTRIQIINPKIDPKLHLEFV